MSDVVLINPSSTNLRINSAAMLKNSLPPLGLAYIAAVLEKRGYTVSIIDMQAKQVTREDLARILLDEKPQLIGLTTMVASYMNALRISRFIKEFLPAVKIVVGGPQASFLPEETLREPAVDAVCLFEGEETVREIADRVVHGSGKDWGDIQGIAFRRHDEVVVTERRAFYEDLDSLPYPARHLLDLRENYLMGSIIAGRGCPYKCIFCTATAISGARCRLRSLDNIIGELSHLNVDYGISRLHFLDDTLSVSHSILKGLCEYFQSGHVPWQWSCEARANTLNHNLLKLMAAAGCKSIQYGVESGNQEVLNQVAKGIDLRHVDEIVRMTAQEGISPSCTFIVGFPFDTEKTVQDSIDFAKKLKRYARPGVPVNTFFAILTPLPGSYVYTHADDLGITLHSNNWDLYDFGDPVISTKHLTREQIRGLYYQGMQVTAL